MSRGGAPGLVAAGTVVLAALLLAWNVGHFPWLRSYDASASNQYVQVLEHEHRLPRKSETDVWHNPPLFYLAAGAVTVAADRAGVAEPARAVQVLSAVCVLLTMILTMLLARELFPRSRWLPVLALVLAATTPVLVRAGALYHPEPLATVLTTAGLYVAVRGLARRALSWRVGLLAGTLLGLANLTRTWALAALGAALIGLAAAALRRVDGRARAALIAACAAAAVLVVPWLVVKTVVYGSPLAYSRPVPSQWQQTGRPAAFWLPPSPLAVVREPYNPRFQNRLVPVVYADWWGDYWRAYRIPAALHDRPATLPSGYARPLQRQAAVGWIVGLAALAGLVALTARAVRRHDLALATLLLSLGLLVLSYVGFLVQYPKLDGDNMKALYVLDAAPVIAIAAAFPVGRLAARGPAWRAAVLASLAVVIVPTIAFLVLPA